jgi:hypothetical protein
MGVKEIFPVSNILLIALAIFVLTSNPLLQSLGKYGLFFIVVGLLIASYFALKNEGLIPRQGLTKLLRHWALILVSVMTFFFVLEQQGIKIIPFGLLSLDYIVLIAGAGICASIIQLVKGSA